MSALSDLQTWLAAHIVRARDLVKDPEAIAGADARLASNDRLTRVEQLEIYREQFWLRHTAALLEDFPGLAGILGQAEWERLAESYLAAHPCKSFSLRDLGASLPDHIATLPDLPHPVLCHDMARLEWGYVEIFDAADVPPLDGDKLARIPAEDWARAQIAFNPALRLLQVTYPVVALRQALRQASASSSVPIPDPEPHNLLLFRTADRVLQQRSLALIPFQLLRSLHAGQPLAAASEAVAKANPNSETEIETQVGAWFAEWARLGIITDVQCR